MIKYLISVRMGKKREVYVFPDKKRRREFIKDLKGVDKYIKWRTSEVRGESEARQ